MKKIATAALCALILCAALLVAACGGRGESTPLYGKTVTFTGKTMAVDWDGQTGAGYADGESETPVGELLDKYFAEVDWESTVYFDNTGVLAGLTDADKASAEAFKAFIGKASQGLYSSLEGCTVTAGAQADTVDVTVKHGDWQETYKCSDTSPDKDGTVLSSEWLSGENWEGNAGFGMSWNGVREYFTMNIPGIPGISIPVYVLLYRSDGNSLLSILLIAETTVA